MSEPEQPEHAPALQEKSQPPQKTEFSLQRTYWAGPLPAPDILNKYDPDTRRAIVAMAEKEQNHRHARLDKGQRDGSRARIFGFVLVLSTLISGVYLVSAGKAFIMAGLLLVASISELIYRSVSYLFRKN